MKLYRVPFSTNVERVALALAYKGLEAESVWIDYDDRREVVAVSGQPLVPVLVDGDRVIPDSTAITRYLEEKHPEPALFPRGAARRAEMDVFLEWFNDLWKRPPNLITQELEKPEPDQARIAELGGRMQAWLDLFEGLLDGRDYLFGDFCVADCAAFPFLKYAVLWDEGDEHRFHEVCRDHQQLGDTHPGLEAWIRRVDERPRA